MEIKKLLSILCLSALLLFSLISCNDDSSNKPDGPTLDTAVLTLTADKTTANAGQTVTFSSLLKNGEETSVPKNVTYSITEGADHATLTDNKLTVKETAPNGAEIKVQATAGEVTSNVVTITVVKPLTALAISADKSGEVDRGSFINLTVTKTPADSAEAIKWVIVEGEDKATVAENKLFIHGDAIGGTIIKVKATAGAVESEVLTFTVKLNETELNDTRFIIQFDEDNVTLDKNGLVAPTLTVTVYNRNLEEVTDQIVDFSIVEGDNLVSIDANGTSCALTALGHGTAKICAKVRGTAISETATVNVIVPPQAITLPEVLRERPNHSYAFSMKNPATGAAYSFPFVASPVGTNVCTDLAVTFTHADGSTGDGVAVYADNKITFLKTGLVTVTVTSNSGSRYETSVSYKFDINNGYNISTFEELAALASNPAYTGTLPINLVVTEKPVGAGKEYGYDLVPATALLAKDAQTFADVISANNTVSFVNKGVIINGNYHNIDASALRVPTSDELTSYTAQGGKWGEHNALIHIYPWAEGTAPIATYRVEIYNLTVVGNCPIDYETTSHKPGGVYNRGIMIGDLNEEHPANYYLTMSNVQAEAFRAGFRLLHIVDGRIDNAKVDNCFGNGFEIGGSILTLNNTTYGACGATGIEIVPEHSSKAGVGRNQNQQITYAGSVKFTFLNNNNTRYMQNYKLVDDYGVPEILQGAFSLNNLTNEQIAHFVNGSEQIGYVTFKFHDIGTGTPNTSEIIYPGFQAGGIINATQLPKDGSVDTTHEYIEIDILAQHPQLGLVNAGKAYFYNHKYIPAN